MTIYWCGIEEIDLKNLLLPYRVNEGYCDTYVSRVGIGVNNQMLTTLNVHPTPLTSLWISSKIYTTPVGASWFGATDENNKGIYGIVDTAGNRISINKYDGSAWTELSYGTGGCNFTAVRKIDINIINYGSNSTIVLYLNGVLYTSYTGDTSISNVSGFTNISFKCNDSSRTGEFSEIIVANEDTRLMRVKTLTPNAIGDNNAWNGSYTNIDEIGLDINDVIYSNINDSDFQCNLTGMPSYGDFEIMAVRIVANCVDGTGNMGVQLGVKTNGSISLGNTETAPNYWQTKELLMETNPVTGLQWTPSEINALQFNIRAKSL